MAINPILVKVEIIGLVGVTEIESNVGGGGGGRAVQVYDVLPEINPKVAVTCTVPAETQVTAWVSVRVSIFAIAELDDDQPESLVTPVVNPLERVAMAVNPSEEFTA